MNSVEYLDTLFRFPELNKPFVLQYGVTLLKTLTSCELPPLPNFQGSSTTINKVYNNNFDTAIAYIS